MAEEVFKERFAELIQLRGYSQKEIAQRTHLTESAISHYLKGDRVPKGAILLNIANTLGTTTDYLQGKTDDSKPAGEQEELDRAFQIIARNAKDMSMEDRDRFIRILFKGDETNDKRTKKK